MDLCKWSSATIFLCWLISFARRETSHFSHMTCLDLIQTCFLRDPNFLHVQHLPAAVTYWQSTLAIFQARRPFRVCFHRCRLSIQYQYCSGKSDLAERWKSLQGKITSRIFSARKNVRKLLMMPSRCNKDFTKKCFTSRSTQSPLCAAISLSAKAAVKADLVTPCTEASMVGIKAAAGKVRSVRGLDELSPYT